MKDLFIPYPLAAIAKEKGFNRPCLTTWQPKHLNPNEWILNSINCISLHAKEPQTDSFKAGFTGYVNSVPPHFGLNYISAPMYQQIIDWAAEDYSYAIDYSSDKNILNDRIKEFLHWSREWMIK